MAANNFASFLTEGSQIPSGSALKASTSQTVLPDWYTNYALDILSGQKAVADRPYETFPGPRVAGFTPAQQQAFNQTGQAATAYQPGLSYATNLATGLTGRSALSTAAPYINSSTGYNPITSAMPDLSSARGALSTASGINSINAAQPYYQGALSIDPRATADPYYGTAGNSLVRATGYDAVRAADPYLKQASGIDPLAAASPDFSAARSGVNRAQGYDLVGAADPYFQGATSQLMSSTSPLGLDAAQPWLNKAGGDVANVSAYFNPYQDAVVNRIADLGKRNLDEVLLPGIEGRYISSGQWRGSGQTTDTVRALRDISADVLAEQDKALQAGYSSAQAAKAGDLARYAGLASTAGGLGTEQQRALANAGNVLADIGSQRGALTQAQQNAELTGANLLAGLGRDTGSLADSRAKMLADIGANYGNLSLGQGTQSLNTATTAGNLGTARAGLDQEQQRILASLGTNAGNLAQGDRAGIIDLSQGYSGLGSTTAALNQDQRNYLAKLGIDVGNLEAGDISQGYTGAGTLANLAGLAQNYGLTGAGALSGVGGQQQQQNQQNLDVAYADFLRQQGYPQDQIDKMLATFKGVATGVPSASTEFGIVPTGDQALYKPGTASQIAAGLTGLAGLASALKGIF